MKKLTLKDVNLKRDDVLTRSELRKLLGGGSGESESGSPCGSTGSTGSESGPSGSSSGSESGSESGSGSGDSGYKIGVEYYGEANLVITIDQTPYTCYPGWNLLPVSYYNTQTLFFDLPCTDIDNHDLTYSFDTPFNQEPTNCGYGVEWYIQESLTITVLTL